jgi:hypothetical protein
MCSHWISILFSDLPNRPNQYHEISKPFPKINFQRMYVCMKSHSECFLTFSNLGINLMVTKKLSQQQIKIKKHEYDSIYFKSWNCAVSFFFFVVCGSMSPRLEYFQNERLFGTHNSHNKQGYYSFYSLIAGVYSSIEFSR